MADKTQANIGFEKQIWDAACVLWGHIPAAEYRKVIIGLIFLRYVSTAFEGRYYKPNKSACVPVSVAIRINSSSSRRYTNNQFGSI